MQARQTKHHHCGSVHSWLQSWPSKAAPFISLKCGAQVAHSSLDMAEAHLCHEVCIGDMNEQIMCGGSLKKILEQLLLNIRLHCDTIYLVDILVLFCFCFFLILGIAMLNLLIPSLSLLAFTGLMALSLFLSKQQGEWGSYIFSYCFKYWRADWCYPYSKNNFIQWN